ncbi:basic leucine zipper transcriptional factor ATF-like 2 isoform X5 [Macaca fascicularis]|uniref:basic leucine zipper transcriptional factor ATF-like 2 isoform X5 n=1 Tax=Macaca fascicularis TaxID=9541 RepID=UPI003D15E001
MHLCRGNGLLTGTDPEEQQRLLKKQKNRAAAQRSRQKHTDKADALHQFWRLGSPRSRRRPIRFRVRVLFLTSARVSGERQPRPEEGDPGPSGRAGVVEPDPARA